jgi:type IV pilus assembly protein PilA
MPRAGLLVTAISLAIACDSKTDTPATPSTSDTAPAIAAALAPGPTLTGTITLSDAIPAEAFAVAVVRMPGSWLETMKGFDPIGASAEDYDTLRKDLDEITQARLGIVLGDVSGASAFAIDEETFAAVIDGVSGTPRGKADAQGIVVLDGFPDVHALMVGKQLVIGSPKAVAAAAVASKDPSKRLSSNADITGWITANTDGASAVVAVDVTRAPKKLVGGVKGVERGFAVLGAKRFAVAVEGEPAVIAGLAAQADILVKAGLEEMRRLEATMRKSDDTLTVLGAAFTAHQVRRFEKLAKPVADGKRLSLEIPLDTQNATSLVAMAGIGAAIAIPALTKYMRRSKTSEARVQLAKMFDGASAAFNEEVVARAGVALLAAHGCPNDGRASGTAGVTPPLSVDCNAGPGGRCVPAVAGGRPPGYYDMRLWSDNPVWSGLNFQMEQGHYFHYDFKWTNSGTGFGACQFTAQAFGDLDGDGVWSTFERAGAADHLGVNAAAGLYIDQEVE